MPAERTDEAGEESRPGHVRFAENDEQAPRRHRRPSRRHSSRSQGQPIVYSLSDDEEELIEWPNRRQNRRRGQPQPPSVPVPLVAPTARPGRPTLHGEPRDSYSEAQPEPAVRFTESPPPIESRDNSRRRWIRGRRRSTDHRSSARRRRIGASSSRSQSSSDPDLGNASGRPSSAASSGDDEWGSSYPARPLARSHYRPPSVASDDFDHLDKFEFTLPSHSMTESSRDVDSDTETPDSEGKTLRPDEEVTIRTGKGSKAASIHASRYTGNAELGGTHTVTLRELHNPKGQKKPLFRWLHIRQEVMHFEDFWTEVSRITGLSEIERKAVTRLRADVQRNCVKSRYNPKGTKVGYLETRAFEVPLKMMTKKQETDENKPQGSARWICIPYFCLEQYSGLLAASNPGSFPTQTLLQTQYSRNTPQRDMEQAVCQLGTAKREECFHVAQLWGLILENSLLVTCGTMTQSELQSESIKIIEEPSRDATSTSNKGTIIVSYGESVTWSFAADECPTWFAFISKFQAFWPQIVEFRRRDKVISAEDWPKILRQAANSQAPVRIEVKSRPLPEAPPRGVLRHETSEQLTPLQDKGKSKPANNDLHILALVSGDGKTAASENLTLYLAAAEKFLAQETSFANRKAFKNSDESTRTETLNYISELASRVEENGSDDIRKAYEDRIDIFNAADIVYGFYLPRDVDDITSRKFWGCLRKLLTLWELEEGDYDMGMRDNISEARGSFRSFAQEVQAFQAIMSQAGEEERRKIEAPRDCFTSWLYLVMSVIHVAGNRGPSASEFVWAKSWATKGMEEVIHGLSNVDLLEKATILPLEVLSLLAIRLLRDQVGKADDICETYSQYLNSLEVSITSKPSDRSYQHRIDLVQQEMTAIKRVLARQRTIINAVRSTLTATSTAEVLIQSREEAMVRRSRERDYYQQQPAVSQPWTRGHDDVVRRQHYGPATIRPADDYMNMEDEFVNDLATASKLSPTDAGGLRQLLFTECSRFIEQREFEFRRYSEYADDLGRAVSYKMEFTKDRQENAIFAFTLVTIIFLPMSAVSSIFGMNTKDIRDMEHNQWLYWSVALPLTFVVVITGLWGMNELGNLARWIMRKPRHKAVAYGGMAMPPAPEQPYAIPVGAPAPSEPPAPLIPQWVPASRFDRRGSHQYYGPPPGWAGTRPSARTTRAARY